MTLPHGAVGWSAVFDVVFPDHTHLYLKKNQLRYKASLYDVALNGITFP